MKSLSRSIAENGILQPVTVRKISATEYELVAGERRLRASALAGLKKVPCIIVKCTDKESAVYALLENLQRADLGMFEEARGISRLIRRYGLTQEQAWIEKSGLSERHARALLKLDNENARRDVLSQVITEGLNVSQTEALVSLKLQSAPVKHNRGAGKAVIKDFRIFVNTINKAVDVMRLAGIDAKTHTSDNDNFIEYTIRIPKSQIIKAEKSA